MRGSKYYLYLDEKEASIVLHSLIRMKNALIKQGRYTDCVDELILKVSEAPVKKV